MKNHLVSVIIPVYNVERYLDKCVESVINQTYANLEIILVDDGSPDKCPKKCDEYAKIDKRIKVIHKENGGLSSARNVALDVCTGDYIVFVDSDDFIHKTMIEKLLQISVNYKADLSCCALKLIYENGKDNLAKNDKSNYIKIFSGVDVVNNIYHSDIPFIMASCAKLYDRRLFEKIRYPLGRLHEDEYVFARILSKTKILAVTDEQLYFYLQRNNSISYKKKENNIRDLLIIFKDRYNFLEKEFKINHDKNVKLYLSELRYLFSISKNYKDLSSKIRKEFKKYYKLTKSKNKKDLFFYMFPKTYRILFLIKNKKLK